MREIELNAEARRVATELPRATRNRAKKIKEDLGFLSDDLLKRICLSMVACLVDLGLNDVTPTPTGGIKICYKGLEIQPIVLDHSRAPCDVALAPNWNPVPDVFCFYCIDKNDRVYSLGAIEGSRVFDSKRICRSIMDGQFRYRVQRKELKRSGAVIGDILASDRKATSF